ncbi:MAG: SusD/RagB family nutrient-binding outer membrane lipoprotein [Sphingobacteriales bacterium]
MKKYISIITVIALVAGLGSCKKSYLDLEANPNSPSQSTPQLVLAGALVTAPAITVGYVNPYDVWSGYLSWNGGVVPPSTLFEYTFTNGTYGGFWTGLYSNATNFNNLINMSKAPALANFQAIGMIMKVWDFEQLVDNYGDVPYSQAFQPSTILFPKYDKAVDIYADLPKQLDAAIALAGTGTVNPGASDPMFAGDMSKWKQVANTLKLRLAIRESNISGGTPYIANLAAPGTAYLDADATINPGYANAVGQQNPFYGNFGKDPNGNAAGNSNVFRANAFSVKFLKDNNDTLRLARIFSLVVPVGAPVGTPASVYYGNVYGDAINIKNTINVSGAGPGLAKSPTQSSLFISASESYLLQAEAVERGWLTGDAAALYKLGIEANFAYLGLTKAQADTYTTAHPLGSITDIIDQKYITFMNGYDSFEAFNDYRRLGIPALPSSVDPSALSDHLPTRLYYPSTEQTTNLNNYNAAGGNTMDPFSTKIFWAK